MCVSMDNCFCHPLFNRDTVFPDKIIQNLGELGLVSLLAFGSLERSDTGSYMCTATNSLPGGQTGIRMAESPPTTLTVLGQLFSIHLVCSWIYGTRDAIECCTNQYAISPVVNSSLQCDVIHSQRFQM